MSSVQRRRGRYVTFWRTKLITDSRGNLKKVADPDSKVTVRAAVIPQRSQRAEVGAGQVEINVTRVIVDAGIPGVDLWSRAELDGEEWDVVTPPSLRWGTRQTRHWSIDLRQRPSPPPKEAPGG
ncbi:phage head-tail adapter protein [Puerhibacterium puerhi]|uniref:phage head-tail adapter protein n=1 Tax=Puerhibacterium puerhi TaxID=2692623 RepID=UPI00135CDCFC|nr:phage head-tail adapter protein [Puerhibacterium puerhi]